MNLAAMRRARDEVAELLEATIATMDVRADAGDAEVGRTHEITGSYLRLVRAAVDRFEEAARGA